MTTSAPRDGRVPRRIAPGPVPKDAYEFRVQMRDGIELATDVYFPAELLLAPALLVRLPYDKNGDSAFMPAIARAARNRGYVAVVQDVRGKYRSDGETVFAVHEAEDGYDTIEWIVSQSWSDGSVVMWGDSYFGMTALAAATTSHEALRAIAPRLTGTQLGRVLRGESGASDVEQASFRELFALYFADRESIDWSINWSARPLTTEFERYFAALGSRSISYDREVCAPGLTSAIAIDDLLRARPIPVLFTIGWFDLVSAWSWYDVDQLRSHPGWSASLSLRLEGIDHHNGRFSDAYNTDDSPPHENLVDRLINPALAFFDHQLNRTNTTPPPKVTYEVCGGGWHESSVWPPPDVSTHVFYGAVTGSTSRVGTLEVAPPVGRGELEWISNGIDLVPSVAGDPYRLLSSPRDLAPDANRSDIATLDTAPLNEELVLLGPVRLSGEFASNSSWADLFARLLDVAPSGQAKLIARGQVHVPTFGSRRAVEVDLQHVAYRVPRGHRLRLNMACSDFPQFVFTPGDGTSGWEGTEATQMTASLSIGGIGGIGLAITVGV